MKDIKGKVSIAVVLAVLGLIVSMQFQTVRKTTDGGFLSTQRAQQLTIELKKLRTEKERLNQDLVELERRLKEYEQSEADENYVIRNLKSDLSKYQILSGFRSIEGPGVIVQLEDIPTEYTDESSFLVFHYEYVLDIINKLNAAGAEAISINDQRFMADTEIYNFAASNLLINGVPIAPPIQIKAIGNPETLEAALNMRFGVLYNIKEEGMLKASVKKQTNIVLPRHTRVTKYKFAKPMESVE